MVNGILFNDARKVHHTFRLTDQDSGRVLDKTIEIHTLELGRYNLTEADLATASMRDRWLYWIAEITEDKTMYDAREQAMRNRQWAMNQAHREGLIEGEIKGKIEGKIELIRTLEGILGLPLSDVGELQKLDLDELQKRTVALQDRARNRA